LEEVVFDLARFDAIATNFHLKIPPPDELDAAIRKPASEIARVVNSPPSTPRWKCCNTSLPPITQRDEETAQHNFPWAVDIHRLSGIIQQQNLDVINRITDGHGVAQKHRFTIDEALQRHRRLREPVSVDQQAIQSEVRSERIDIAPVHRFTAKDHETDFLQMLHSRQCIDKMAKYSRGGMKNRNFLLYEAIDKCLNAMLPHGNRINRSAVKQGAEDVLNSSVNAV
jgi:hypothetical protein